MGQRFGGAAALVRKSALEWGRSQIGSENYNYRAAIGKWKNPRKIKRKSDFFVTKEQKND